MHDLHLLTLNVQGLREQRKRYRLYEWLKNQKFGIALVQETHFSNEIVNEINNEINDFATAFHSFGKSNSRGVSVFFSKKLPISIINFISDADGRYIMLNIEIDECFYTIINVYAPNEEKNRNVFFKKIMNSVNDFSQGSVIIGGDFNEVLEQTDRISKARSKILRKTYGLSQCIKKKKLMDIWRIKNPGKRQFTWRRKSLGEASRIDFFLIDQNLTSARSCDIRPAQIQYTDHMAVSLKVEYGNRENKGPGLWKINNSILENTEYKAMVDNLIDTLIERNGEMKLEKPNFWDYCKLMIKFKTIEYCRNSPFVSRHVP